MEDLSMLEAEKQEYLELKLKINSVMKNLKNAKENVNTAKTEFSNAYTGQGGIERNN